MLGMEVHGAALAEEHLELEDIIVLHAAGITEAQEALDPETQHH